MCSLEPGEIHVRDRLLTQLKKLSTAAFWRGWLHGLQKDLQETGSWAFGFSTLMHVALIVLLGGIWIFTRPTPQIAQLDSRWTDRSQTPVLDAPLEMAWAQTEETSDAGGSRSSAAISSAPAHNPQPLRTVGQGAEMAGEWFSDAVADDELGTELSDLDGWRNGLSGIGTGTGNGNGNGDGNGGGFFGAKATGRSIVFVVDCSNSMNRPHASAGTRFRRLKLELLNSVASMKPKQFFYIIFFNERPISMPARTMQPAMPSQQRHYLEWMSRIRAIGGTEPVSSLQLALRLQPDVIYFLTDGNFSSRTASELVQITQPRSAIHTITFGERGAESLMRTIATKNRGTYRFVP